MIMYFCRFSTWFQSVVPACWPFLVWFFTSLFSLHYVHFITFTWCFIILSYASPWATAATRKRSSLFAWSVLWRFMVVLLLSNDNNKKINWLTLRVSMIFKCCFQVLCLLVRCKPNFPNYNTTITSDCFFP